MSTETSILLVSDERAEQEAILRVLRSANPHGQVAVEDNQAAALKRIAEERFHCVFCQLRAGAEESVNFLTEVWNCAPNSGRFVIARGIDAETQIRCAFGSHHYLATPLHPNAVQAAIASAQAQDAILPDDRVQILISRMRTLPSKPSIYFEVMRELHAENATATAIAAADQERRGYRVKADTGGKLAVLRPG